LYYKVESFRKRGLKVAYVTGEDGNEEMKRGVHAGRFQLVFFTPELLINNKRWRRMLSGATYSDRLKGFIVDGAHCVVKW
jgi:ATP-dependent DNA helicase RecQ